MVTYAQRFCQGRTRVLHALCSFRANQAKGPPPPLGAREWLAEMLRWAVADAHPAMPTGQIRHEPCVVDHVLGVAAMSEEKQLDVNTVT